MSDALEIIIAPVRFVAAVMVGVWLPDCRSDTQLEFVADD